MKILYAISLLIFINSQCIAQSYQWKKIGEYSQKNISAWDINPLENIVLAHKYNLIQLDKDFNVMFTQSNKSFGAITNVDARHSLKTLLFSAHQQMLGVVDNTLSFQEGKVDLSVLGVDYASLVCYSDLSNRFWVYDESNSRLIRFEGLKSTTKQIEISNLAGITNSIDPTYIREVQNQLFLFYQGIGTFVFDYYGSLRNKFENTSAKQVYPTSRFVYYMTATKIIRIERATGKRLQVDLPYEGIEDFKVYEEFIYFKDKNGIRKYSLKP